MGAGERHTEVPFAVNVGAGPGRGEVIEGVIDLVFKEEGDRWVVADYKTDGGDDPGLQGQDRAVPQSGRSLRMECWEQLTGEDVAERALVFTAQGRTESW